MPFKDVYVFDGTGWVAKGLAGGQVRSRDVPDVCGGAHLEWAREQNMEVRIQIPVPISFEFQVSVFRV